MRYLIYLFFLVLLGSCSFFNPDVPPEPYQSCISEGNHFALPFEREEIREILQEEFVFDESAVYDHQDEDQLDWNKLSGISLRNLTNHENSLMVAWRWNLDGYLEISPYFHKNGDVFYFEKDNSIPVIKHYLGNDLDIHYAIAGPEITVFVMSATGSFTYQVVFDEDVGSGWRISTYFGGNRPAPHMICVTKTTINLR